MIQKAYKYRAYPTKEQEVLLAKHFGCSRWNLQCNIYRNKNITGLFEIHLHVYYDSNRADLDNSLKIILDCLQMVKAITNDNNCVKILAEKFIDKQKPRIEFELKAI